LVQGFEILAYIDVYKACRYDVSFLLYNAAEVAVLIRKMFCSNKLLAIYD
jgi:hypothetical protein